MALSSGCSPEPPPAGPEEDRPALAPDFSLETIDGDIFKLREMRGKTVMLNFWGTWCEPCLREMPELNRLAIAHPEIAVLGIAVRSGRSSVEALQNDLAIRYPLAIPPKDSTVFDDYEMSVGTAVFPTTFFVNAEGRFGGDRVEGSLRYEQLEMLLASATESH